MDRLGFNKRIGEPLYDSNSYKRSTVFIKYAQGESKIKQLKFKLLKKVLLIF